MKILLKNVKQLLFQKRLKKKRNVVKINLVIFYFEIYNLIVIYNDVNNKSNYFIYNN